MASDNNTIISVNNTSVPNGTSELDEALRRYVDTYMGFAKASAKSVIEQCRTVVEAKYKLSPQNFERFCNEVQLNAESSTFRKVKTIGERAARLLAVVDKLPQSWTTLYLLATLEAAEFDRLVASNILHPLMTAPELRAALQAAKPERTSQPKMLFGGDLTSLVDVDKVSFLAAVQAVAEKHGVKLHLTEALKTLIESYEQQEETLLEAA